jgi:hypothetical protein
VPRRTIRCIFIVFALALVRATLAFGQHETVARIPVDPPAYGWQVAQSAGSTTHKLFVVTFDQPHRRHSCHIQSFTDDKLVCSRLLGRPRTYLREQVAELILPGDGGLRIPLFIGLNAGLGVAIWGTVVLAAACPVCAAATGVAALMFFSGAGAVAYADDTPDRVLYTASGQELSGKLGFVQR